MATKDEMKAEIEELRAELEALQGKSRSSSVADAKAAVEGMSADVKARLQEKASDMRSAVEEIVEELGERDARLKKQLRNAYDEFEQDIQNTKPTTLLAVFALGFLLGRL